ncbi:MAG: N-acetylmuramoyl-L-alanine amidase [Gordonia sp. (in: high G+C Gram-positive bacteria)]|uniref:N-acetylmuramoyl-L-alanine amidase n=1 Tax=Gordonia sp. (in: high G+C Gram-positive bacteria) TaxID=84139 RepID=UPI0039E304CA
MAWSGDPIWLPEVLRGAGCKVIEQPGWRDRGHGDFLTITHVMWHHTAGGGPQDWVLVQNGTNGMAGPLAQLVLERDGTYRIIAAGVAWHAGVGSWPGLPTNNANWHAIGIEAVNDGRGQEWPQVQREAYRIGTAAILRRLGRGADGVVAHKEYAKIQGKIDPYPFDMVDERRRVAALLAGRPPAPVRSEIDHYAAQSANTWIGKRVTKAGTEVPVGPPGGGGRAVEFENAVVYWSKATGAHAVPRGVLLEEYQRRGGTGGALGFPAREFTRLTKNPRGDLGAVQAFERGVLYKRDADERGYPVFGRIGEHWAQSGYENGPAGYPTSDERELDGGFIAQDFQYDRLVFSPSMVVPASVLQDRRGGDPDPDGR